MDKIIKSTENLDIRLDKYLIDHLDQTTRTQIQLMIDNGEILVNNKPTKASYKLRINDEVLIKFVEPKSKQNENS